MRFSKVILKHAHEQLRTRTLEGAAWDLRTAEGMLLAMPRDGGAAHAIPITDISDAIVDETPPEAATKGASKK